MNVSQIQGKKNAFFSLYLSEIDGFDENEKKNGELGRKGRIDYVSRYHTSIPSSNPTAL